MKRKFIQEDEYGSESDGEPEEVGVKYATNGKKANGRDSGGWPSQDNFDSQGEDDSLDDEGASGESSDDDSDEDNDDANEIPLGQLIALKQDGSTAGPAMRARAKALKASNKASFKREHKHRPVEMSSKRPVPVLRETIQGGKHHSRDPRFDPLTARGKSGKIDDNARRRYAFLYDEKLPQEKRELQEALKKTKSEARKAEIKAQLSKITQQQKAEASRRRKESVEKEERQKRSESRAAGKNPYYLKKSEKRRQELLSKYEELKATGGLERYMEKKRKKNASKDHRYLPSRRAGME